MSVRATGKLIGELVIVTDLPTSPKMVVKAVDEKTKIATAFWFNNDGEYRENQFNVEVLDRAKDKDVKQTAKTAKVTKSRKAVKK
jgi:hypothetical protein